jgi:tripartite-type tricarboxylate transporter receptor subunit TctC
MNRFARFGNICEFFQVYFATSSRGRRTLSASPRQPLLARYTIDGIGTDARPNSPSRWRIAMKIRRRQFLRLALSASAVPFLPPAASALNYPTRPVRLIVPYPAGGTTDIFARLAAQRLSQRLGKQFYVENIVGASGNVATGQAARAAPDGHTILVAFTNFVINPSMFAKIPYDPYKDFEPITLAVTTTNVLMINPSVPAKSLNELFDLIRANPGKYTFASPGAGTPAHLGESWVGVLVPAGTAKDIVALLHHEITGALPDLKERLMTLGLDPIGSTPEEFGSRIKAETKAWGEVIRAAGIMAQ